MHFLFPGKGIIALLSPGAVDGGDCYLFYFRVFVGRKCFEIITKSSV